METTRPSEKVISAILNCVCPECGGPISLEVNEFRCHGLCGKDWRPFWDRVLSEPKHKTTGRASN